MTLPDACPSLPPDLPGLPRDEAGPVFAAPWQAQAFALVVALHERGAFTWPEWAQALGERIREAPAQPGEDAGAAYWRQWLAALEGLLAARQVAPEAQLQRHRAAWAHALDRTPHGQPLELRACDFPPAG